MTGKHLLDQIVRGLDGVTAEEAKLKADVARVIDGEAWKAMDDGRDALEGSLWHLRRDWALEKASQIIGLVSEARSAIPAEATVTALQEALEPFANVAEHDIGSDETSEDFFAPMERHNRAPRLRVGDLRRARTALSQIRSEK